MWTCRWGHGKIGLCGTIDIEKAPMRGSGRLSRALLAQGERGLPALRSMRVNLLDDHPVMCCWIPPPRAEHAGAARVSVRHPARLRLIGSQSRGGRTAAPSCLDRFGMSVEVRTVARRRTAGQVVDQRTSFDADPRASTAPIWPARSPAGSGGQAQHLLPSSDRDDLRLRISSVCGKMRWMALRGDIVIQPASRALAAFEGAAR